MMVAQQLAKDTVLTPPKLGKLNLIRASDVAENYGLNILVYGQSGTGKTTLAASAQDSPYGRDVLFVDLEGGALSLRDRADIALYRPQSLGDIANLVQALSAEKHGYKTVVIDSLTELQNLAIESVTGKDKTHTIDQRGWGTVNHRLLQVVRAFRSLTYDKQINTILTALAKDKETAQGTGVFKTEPALTPGSVNNVTAAVDTVAYMTYSPKTDKRVLFFEGSGKFIAKVRQPMSQKRIPADMENPTMPRILALLRGEAWQEGKAM